MFVKFWYYVVDCGDGSVHVQFFTTEKRAQQAAIEDLGDLDLLMEGAIGSKVLNVNDGYSAQN